MRALPVTRPGGRRDGLAAAGAARLDSGPRRTAARTVALVAG